MRPAAWLVVGTGGYRAVELDRQIAERRAEANHARVEALVSAGAVELLVQAVREGQERLLRALRGSPC